MLRLHETQATQDYDPVYFLLGEENEVALFKQQIASLALAAVASNELQISDADGLLEGIVSRDEVKGRYRQAFEQTLINSQLLMDERREQLIKAGAAGYLTAADVSYELSTLRESLLATTACITKDGYTAFIGVNEREESGCFPLVESVDDAGPQYLGTGASEKAEELGLCYLTWQETQVNQSEVFPQVSDISVFEDPHIVLGRLNESEEFEPILTVLSETHPARAATVN